MSVINGLGFFKDLESLPWGWGVLVEASSVVAGEKGMKPAAVAMAACH